MEPPKTRYARAGDLSIAYQVVGSGPLDLVLVPGFATHVEIIWEAPAAARFFERLASFSRLILFDKRGTGLSDPVSGVPTLEERMLDVRAVMDAAGSERAALFGVSEGAPMSVLFAATYPGRTAALVLHGAMARSTEAPDYPWAAPADALREAAAEFVGPFMAEGAAVEIFAPSLADDPQVREFAGRYYRYSATPAMYAQIFRMFLDIDVRPVLPALRVPTLVLHRRGDRVVNVRAGRWLAEQIPGARFVELPGIDHLPWAGDAETLVDEVEEFLTGARHASPADRVLATVVFTDLVGSTERAAELGDRKWKELLTAHDDAVRRQLARFGGHEVKTTGDGFLATFDGPARAINCSLAIHDAVRRLGLEARVGIHSGECEMTGGDVRGIAVHIASRVCALADPGEVLVSETVKGLVAGSGIKFEDRGAQGLKGVPDEWRLFSVRPG